MDATQREGSKLGEGNSPLRGGRHGILGEFEIQGNRLEVLVGAQKLEELLETDGGFIFAKLQLDESGNLEHCRIGSYSSQTQRFELCEILKEGRFRYGA